MRKEHLKAIGWTLVALGLGACADTTPTSPRLSGSDGGLRLAASSNVAGADFTTNNPAVDGSGTCANGPDRDSPSVNCNLYAAKRFVWINGGPTNGANALTPGTYFFAVLAPSGQSSPNDGDDDNLSDDYDTYLNRRFTVGADGKITAYIPDANPLTPNHDKYNLASPAQLMLRAWPYADTPNPGGVYIMAICRIDVGGYPVDPKQCKYDAFKVVEGITIIKQIVAVYAASDGLLDANGNPNMIVDPLAHIGVGGLAGTAVIPNGPLPAFGDTRWILYRITVDAHGQPISGSLSVTDNMKPFCNLLPTVHCDSPSDANVNPGLHGPLMNRTWTFTLGPSGRYTIDFFADVTNTDLCGQGELDNGASLTLPGGQVIQSNIVPLTITAVCPPS